MCPNKRSVNVIEHCFVSQLLYKMLYFSHLTLTNEGDIVHFLPRKLLLCVYFRCLHFPLSNKYCRDREPAPPPGWIWFVSSLPGNAWGRSTGPTQPTIPRKIIVWTEHRTWCRSRRLERMLAGSFSRENIPPCKGHCHGKNIECFWLLAQGWSQQEKEERAKRIIKKQNPGFN